MFEHPAKLDAILHFSLVHFLQLWEQQVPSKIPDKKTQELSTQSYPMEIMQQIKADLWTEQGIRNGWDVHTVRLR